MNDMKNFNIYYDNILEEAEDEPSNIDYKTQAELYVYVKLQLYFFKLIFENDTENMNENYLFGNYDNANKINELNENKYMELCESAKEVYYINNTLVKYFLVANLKKCNISIKLGLFQSALDKYFELDTSLTNDEKIACKDTLNICLNDDFALSL